MLRAADDQPDGSSHCSYGLAHAETDTRSDGRADARARGRADGGADSSAVLEATSEAAATAAKAARAVIEKAKGLDSRFSSSYRQ